MTGTTGGENDADVVEDGGGSEPNATKCKLKPGRKKVRNDTPKQNKVENPKGSEVEAVCKCGSKVNHDSNGCIECDICKMWFHPRCEGLTDEVVTAIESHNLFWPCAGCRSYMSEFREVVKGRGAKGKSQSAVAVTDVTGMSEKVKALNENVESVSRSLIEQRKVLLEIGSMVKDQSESTRKDLEVMVKSVVRKETVTYADMVKRLENKIETGSVQRSVRKPENSGILLLTV